MIHPVPKDDTRSCRRQTSPDGRVVLSHGVWSEAAAEAARAVGYPPGIGGSISREE